MLDDVKKREIIALLSVGSSRRTAASYVGCSPSTIARTALRDERFADELRKAGQATEINCLRNIQDAAKKAQYWRAAAWALERCHPDRYAARDADTITLEQARGLLGELARIIVEEVAAVEQRKSILKRVHGLIRGLLLSRDKRYGEDNPDAPNPENTSPKRKRGKMV
ncbi:MAG: hypothetical protein GX621_16635 [Pirellulaceae bacterium]|nr:hypothetical protein [Pirellulaceae bacterium]